MGAGVTQSLGPEHTAVAEVLDRLGSLHRAKGHHAFAQRCFLRAFAIHERQLTTLGERRSSSGPRRHGDGGE
jgi:hypothetical protein